MKRNDSYPVLDQTIVRGAHERATTDTAMLAAELSTSHDFNRITADFDNGVTLLRDVGGMFTSQREAILNAYSNDELDVLANSYPEILSTPVANLHRRITLGPKDQPLGHNFFVNAYGFLKSGHPWAIDFDKILFAKTGFKISSVVNSSDKTWKDRILEHLTASSDIEINKTIAVYLAGRSLEGERYLGNNYGEVLNQAKYKVFKTTQSIAATTGLSLSMLERVANQIQRTSFGSFDHLQGFVTSQNSGAAGDYLIGSLRIEIQFEGSVRAPRLRDDYEAGRILAHEVHHASSAQLGTNRCGLQYNGQGLEANEGMTEYLTQISIGTPDILRFPDGSMGVRPGLPYRAPVFAMLALHERYKLGQNNHFAYLFNAYHGDKVDKRNIEQALDSFYRLNINIANGLRC